MIVILTAAVIVMSTVKLTYKYDPSKEFVPTTPLLTPTTVLLPTEAPITPEEASGGAQRTYESDYPLWALLPYQGKGFEVDRYLAPRRLAVKARGLDEKIATEEVEKWLEANDIDPVSHELIFVN